MSIKCCPLREPVPSGFLVVFLKRFLVFNASGDVVENENDAYASRLKEQQAGRQSAFLLERPLSVADISKPSRTLQAITSP